MNRQKLSISVMAGVIAIALPIAVALAAGGGNGGTSGGSSGGSSSGGGSSAGGGGTLTITSDSDANADYQKAQSAIAGADYKTAADLLQKVLTRQPDNPDVLNLMGFSERKMGEASTALMYY